MRRIIELWPGTVIRTRVIVGGIAIWHEGIVTDQYGSDGSRTVISHSKKAGTTIHEAMTEFHQGAGFEVVGYLGKLHPSDVLDRAWADVERRPRWTLESNCQHAVRRWHGVPAESPQVQGAMAVGGLIALVAFTAVAAKAA